MNYFVHTVSRRSLLADGKTFDEGLGAYLNRQSAELVGFELDAGNVVIVFRAPPQKSAKKSE